MSSLFSPEAILMLFLAGLLDLIGVICLLLDLVFGIGEVLSYIPDGIGILFFGAWTLMRSQGEKSKEEVKEEMGEKVAERQKKIEEMKKKRMKKKAKKTVKKGAKRGLRFGLAALGELIPVIGALPFWTIFVYSELKS
ncbi:MAG: hypothetical protein WBC21_02585 [Minisyncoccales bacterium]